MKPRLKDAWLAPAVGLMSLPAQAQIAVERPSYWHHGWDWGWGHMVFGSLMMIVFWGGLVVLVVLAVRWLGGGATKTRERRTALDILEERFARGEIDRAEFEERRRLLSD